MKHGVLEPVKPGSGDKHCDVVLFLPADMAAHIALDGQGGTRDTRKQFCTHCDCYLKHRHMPFILTRVETDTTVSELATQHEMPVNLFWALNAGMDPDGMFNATELSEEVLKLRTRPLASDSDSANAPAADSELVSAAPGGVDATAQPDVTVGGTSSAVTGGDLGVGPGRRPRKKQPVTQAEGRGSGGGGASESNRASDNASDSGTIREGYLRSMTNDQGCELGSVRVPRGTVVRVMHTYKLERRSRFVDKYLVLERERSVLFAFACRASLG